MQGKLIEYWLRKRHISVTESKSKNKGEQNVYENAAATSGTPKSPVMSLKGSSDWDLNPGL